MEFGSGQGIDNGDEVGDAVGESGEAVDDRDEREAEDRTLEQWLSVGDIVGRAMVRDSSRLATTMFGGMSAAGEGSGAVVVPAAADPAADADAGPPPAREPIPFRAALDREPAPAPAALASIRAALHRLVADSAGAAAYLGPGGAGRQTLLTEPAGLASSTVAALAARANRAADALAARAMDRPGDAPATMEQFVHLADAVAWRDELGVRAVALEGAGIAARQVLDSARAMIQSLIATPAESAQRSAAAVARELPGVLWVEEAEGRLRILLAEDADERTIAVEVRRAAGPERSIDWVLPLPEVEERTIPSRAPVTVRAERPRLVDVRVRMDEGAPARATATLTWQRRELTGTGESSGSVVGRFLAVARAVSDALSPAIHEDVRVEHLHVAAAPGGVDLAVASVRVGDARFVGAAIVPSVDSDLGPARAVLDALNRGVIHRPAR